MAFELLIFLRRLRPALRILGWRRLWGVLRRRAARRLGRAARGGGRRVVSEVPLEVSEQLDELVELLANLALEEVVLGVLIELYNMISE